MRFNYCLIDADNPFLLHHSCDSSLGQLMGKQLFVWKPMLGTLTLGSLEPASRLTELLVWTCVLDRFQQGFAVCQM